MKKILYLLLLVPALAFAQSTTTLPTPTTAYTPQFRYYGNAADSLKQVWVSSGSKYNRWYTATEIQKLYGKSFKAKMDSVLAANNNWTGVNAFKGVPPYPTTTVINGSNIVFLSSTGAFKGSMGYSEPDNTFYWQNNGADPTFKFNQRIKANPAENYDELVTLAQLSDSVANVSGRYIQNQNDTSQTANFKITGVGQAQQFIGGDYDAGNYVLMDNSGSVEGANSGDSFLLSGGGLTAGSQTYNNEFKIINQSGKTQFLSNTPANVKTPVEFNKLQVTDAPSASNDAVRYQDLTTSASGRVPYSGATTSVNLNGKNLGNVKAVNSDTLVVNGVNGSTGVNQTGKIYMVNGGGTGSSFNNFTVFTDSANVRVLFGPTRHIGFNRWTTDKSGVVNSQVVFMHDTTANGSISLRGPNYADGNDYSEYQLIRGGRDLFLRNFYSGGKWIFSNITGKNSFVVDQTGKATLKATSTETVNAYLSLTNQADVERGYFKYDGTQVYLGTGGTFPLLLQTNGVTRLNFSSGGTGVFSQAPALAGTGVVYGNGSSAATFLSTTGTGNAVLATSPTLVSSTNITGSAGSSRDIIYQTSGSNRWVMRVDGASESGSNAGSNFSIIPRADDGSALPVALSANRSTSEVTINKLLVPTAATGTNTTQAASTAFVQNAIASATPNITAKSANYTIVSGDFVAGKLPELIVQCTATTAFNVTLPSASLFTGYQITIKKIDASANAVTVVGTIDGVTNYSLTSTMKVVTVYSDGTGWFIKSNN